LPECAFVGAAVKLPAKRRLKELEKQVSDIVYSEKLEMDSAISKENILLQSLMRKTTISS